VPSMAPVLQQPAAAQGVAGGGAAHAAQGWPAAGQAGAPLLHCSLGMPILAATADMKCPVIWVACKRPIRGSVHHTARLVCFYVAGPASISASHIPAPPMWHTGTSGESPGCELNPGLDACHWHHDSLCTCTVQVLTPMFLQLHQGSKQARTMGHGTQGSVRRRARLSLGTERTCLEQSR
jgi:hypothetical protein